MYLHSSTIIISNFTSAFFIYIHIYVCNNGAFLWRVSIKYVLSQREFCHPSDKFKLYKEYIPIYWHTLCIKNRSENLAAVQYQKASDASKRHSMDGQHQFSWLLLDYRHQQSTS